jgi:uroporphyrinogen-III synthase
MPGLLDNKRVFITRPFDQSQRLIHHVETLGGIAIKFPVLKIEAVEHDIGFSVTQNIDIMVFTSKNAVTFVNDKIFDRYKLVTYVAMGKGTAQYLNDKSVTDVIFPERGTGSENLLDLPIFEKEQVQGKRILIIKGIGGRNVLEEKIRSRGGIVSELNVYTRLKPGIDADIIEKIWQKNVADVIVITSGEGLDNLIEMIPARYQDQLFNTQLVVLSRRLSEIARSKGFRKKPAVSEFADDDSLVQAIKSIYEGNTA